ncbi:MAG: DUF2937 family protein [Brevirhabdus sp.]
MIRTLCLAGGLAGAVGLSQFPEFSQQYLQRLSGAVNELRTVAVAFDTSAAVAGLERDEALAEIGGNAFEDDLRNTLAVQLSRYDRLSAAETALRTRTPLMRLTAPWHFADPELARATYADYRPAMPVTVDGISCAAIGFAAGWMVVALLSGFLLRPFRRRVT